MLVGGGVGGMGTAWMWLKLEKFLATSFFFGGRFLGMIFLSRFFGMMQAVDHVCRFSGRIWGSSKLKEPHANIFTRSDELQMTT